MALVDGFMFWQYKTQQSHKNFSPCGLCEGLGLSSTMDWTSGWSLTTMRGGRSLLSILAALSWLPAEDLPVCSDSSSLSVSEASPGTWNILITHFLQCLETSSVSYPKDYLGSDCCGTLLRRQWSDVDFVIGVCFRRLALHHDRVSAGHHNKLFTSHCTTGRSGQVELKNGKKQNNNPLILHSLLFYPAPKKTYSHG